MLKKKEALLAYFGEEVEDVDLVDETDEDNVLELYGHRYLVLTDEEADEAFERVVKEELFILYPHVLADTTGLDEEVFRALVQLHDAGNEAILKLVEATCGIKILVDYISSMDGRGVFLSHYDGEENEQGEYYIYKLD